jgi:hypothetical protein
MSAIIFIMIRLLEDQGESQWENRLVVQQILKNTPPSPDWDFEKKSLSSNKLNKYDQN